ncbi:phosphatase [Synergistales bacterium]|nr:phosphatase [Synergistales bacterium]
MITLRADLHMHTIGSGHAFSTVKEMADAACLKKLDVIAITDHGSAMEGASEAIYFRNLSVFPRSIGSVTVLRGIEANIMDMDATLDADEKQLSRLDWVVASLHENVTPPASPADHTQMYLKLADNPLVDMIGHPDTPAYEFDYERVVREFGAKGKIVEVNNEHAFRHGARNGENCRKIASLCKKYGVRIAVNSDAHIFSNVGVADAALAMLGEIGFPEDLILNASASRVMDYVKNKRLQKEQASS